MFKTEIVTQVSVETGFKKSDVLLIMDAIFNAIMDGLVRDKVVDIKSFGKWIVYKTHGVKAVKAYDSKVREIPPSVRVRFRAGNKLKHERLGGVKNNYPAEKKYEMRERRAALKKRQNDLSLKIEDSVALAGGGQKDSP